MIITLNDPVLDLLNEAAFLDPRFKSLTFVSDSKKTVL